MNQVNWSLLPFDVQYYDILNQTAFKIENKIVYEWSSNWKGWIRSIDFISYIPTSESFIKNPKYVAQ